MQSLNRSERTLKYQSLEKNAGRCVSVCESNVKFSKAGRRLKVYYKLGFSRKTPVILLQGDWLANLGFKVQDKVEVIGEKGQLVVRLVE